MSTTVPDLAELLGRVSAGDHAAFQSVYDRTSAKLYGTILRIVRSREVADELLQEVYLRIWQNAGRYVPASGRPMTWMIAVARYAAIDMVRRRSPELPIQAADVSEPVIDPEQQALVRDELGRCLGRLSSPQLECVLLAYCDGYSREELAQRFSAQVPTVKTWLHRALTSLRHCLGAT